MSTSTLPELREFDFSVRVNLASSALCGDARASVVLKLHLRQPDGSERQVRRPNSAIGSNHRQMAMLTSLGTRCCWSWTSSSYPQCSRSSRSSARYTSGGAVMHA